MCQRLSTIMEARKIRQRDLVKALGISATAVCELVRKGKLPATNPMGLLDRVEAYLVTRGCPEAEAARALDELRNPPADEKPGEGVEDKEEMMIIRKQSLVPSTRQHFKLLRNPFADPQCPEDVYLSDDTRYVREIMYDAAVNGNFLAVVGESGSGKSTLREEMLTRLEREQEKVIVIEPSVLGMVDSAVVGKPLSAEHLVSAIIATVAPGTPVPISREGKSRRMKQILRDSARAGFKHVLLIEEAHDMPRFLLKSLKRFWEEKDGQKRLLSIILLGQTELETIKFGNSQADIREVVQRCDMVRLAPLRDCGAFLRHRFARAGADVGTVFEAGAVEALQDRLLLGRDRLGRGVYMGYPLAISNLAIACMNTAARIGERMVTADVVRQVQA